MRLDQMGGQWEEAMTLYRTAEQRLDSKRVRIEKLEEDVAALKLWVGGLPTPEESRRLIALLERLAAERSNGNAR